MAIQKVGSMPNNKTQGMFKPKASKKITRSGWYDFEIKKSTYNEETDILVLRGIPSRIGSDGTRVYYDCISVCVSNKYFNTDESDPIEELFETFDLDIDQEVSADYFAGKRVKIYITLSPNDTGSVFHNAGGFEPYDEESADTVTV